MTPGRMCRPRQSIVSPALARRPARRSRRCGRPDADIAQALAVMIDDRAAFQNEVVGCRHARRCPCRWVAAAYVMASRFARLQPMPTVHLDDRALSPSQAPTPRHFLQNIVTTDLYALAKARRSPARCFRRKARSCSISWSRAPGERLPARLPRGAGRRFRAPADPLQLRAKIEIAKQDQALVAVSWGS